MEAEVWREWLAGCSSIRSKHHSAPNYSASSLPQTDSTGRSLSLPTGMAFESFCPHRFAIALKCSAPTPPFPHPGSTS